MWSSLDREFSEMVAEKKMLKKYRKQKANLDWPLSLGMEIV